MLDDDNFIFSLSKDDILMMDICQFSVICRRLFDKYGFVDNYNHWTFKPYISFNLSFFENDDISDSFLKKLIDTCKFNCNSYDIQLYGKDAFNFLNFIYKDADIRFVNKNLYSAYVDWCLSSLKKSIPVVSFVLKDLSAVVPFKNKPSDIGFQISIIKECKKIDEYTSIYDTGIIVEPEFGWHFKIIPNNSLNISGYLLKNTIHNEFTETVKIILSKVNVNTQEIKFPFECCYLVLERNNHYEIEIKRI